MRKQKKIILIIIILFLIALNLFIFTSKKPVIVCYKDVCLIGESDPVNEIKDLINSSEKALLVVEGDKEKTQKTSFISASLVMLARDFGHKKPMLIGIEFEEGRPVNCVCEDYLNQGFVKCNNSVEYCKSMKPGENSFMVKISYPSYDKNEIIVGNRVIEFKAKSGQDAYAMVLFFEGLIK